jgi:hypothetical protein
MQLFISKFHVSESRGLYNHIQSLPHLLHLGKVKFMEEYGTPPHAYTSPHNTVITGTLINDVLTSPSPSPEPEFTPQASVLAPTPTALPVKPTSCRKVSCPKIDSTQAPIHTTVKLLAHIIMPDKWVYQHGGKTKNKKQETIKKGPIEVSIEIG